MDDLDIYFFRLTRSQEISYLKAIIGNYETMFIESRCTINQSFYRDVKSYLDAIGWCSLI